jgi:hypothetical protein
MMKQRNEVHICSAHNGHCNTVDCWCEPVRIYWYTNVFNIAVLIVEHDDDAHVHRLVRTSARERDKDIPFAPDNKSGVDAPWITRALDCVKTDTPPDPNERRL